MEAAEAQLASQGYLRLMRQRISGAGGLLERLCSGMASGGADPDDALQAEAIYRDAVRLLCRFLVLLYADRRGLLPPSGAGLAALLDDALALQRGEPRHSPRLWERSVALFRALAEALGDQGLSEGLFAAPTSSGAALPDELLADAIVALAYHAAERGQAPQRIDYRGLPIRHLGDLYQELAGGRLVRQVDKLVVEQGGTGRQAAGSYYTPEYVVEFVVRETVGRALRRRRSALEHELAPALRDLAASAGTELQRSRAAVEERLLGFIDAEVLALRVCDPAMGSGHFLANAARQIAGFIVETLGLAGWDSPALPRDPSRWLPQIIVRCLYGVDLDALAVELAHLSLWLEAGDRGLQLAVLRRHLKHGNSLVGASAEELAAAAAPDMEWRRGIADVLLAPSVDPTIDGRRCQELAGALAGGLARLDDGQRQLLARVRALAREHGFFHWPLEFEEGTGINVAESHLTPRSPLLTPTFDVVIGNPPYASYSARASLRARYQRAQRGAELEHISRTIAFCSARYPQVSRGCKDLYKWFSCLALQLGRPAGLVGLVLPSTWHTHTRYADLRGLIFERCSRVEIVELGFRVFGATVPISLLLCELRAGEARRQAPAEADEQGRYVDLSSTQDKERALRQPLPWRPLRGGQRTSPALVAKYLHEWPAGSRLGAAATLREGQHIAREQLTPGHEPGHRPVLDSKNMGRYRFSWQPRYCYRPDQPGQRYIITSGPRLLIRKTGDAIVAALAPEEPSFVLQSLYQTVALDAALSPLYLLGLLNSRFLSTLYQRSAFGQKGRAMAQFRKGYLDQLPLPTLDLGRPEARRQHDRMAELVQDRLDLQARHAAHEAGRPEPGLVQLVERVERAIDQLVYALYGLDDAEIALIEDPDS